jgi:hypothetical protein
VASWCGLAGPATGARDQLAALLPIDERVLGPEHPDTLAASHGLAHWTGQAGDATGARDQLAALLPVFERILGPDHPETLANLGSLAYWTGKQATRLGPATSTLPCSRSASGSSAPSIPTPWAPAPRSPTGPSRSCGLTGLIDRNHWGLIGHEARARLSAAAGKVIA